MPVLTEDLSEDILNDIIYLNAEEKTQMLEFITKECIFSVTLPFDTKVNEAKLVKILCFLATGEKNWSGKTLYGEKELDNVLKLYDRAPEFIQRKLDPLMKELKEEIFGSLE